jgi:hypothetical protein
MILEEVSCCGRCKLNISETSAEKNAPTAKPVSRSVATGVVPPRLAIA